MSRTGTLGRLFAHASEPVLELHPQELARRRWVPGELVRVSSRRGELVLPVSASESVAPAQAFIAMHWGPEYIAGLGVNALTTGAFCPQSRQPELKHAAVRLERIELPWQIVAAAWLPETEALAVRERLRESFPRCAYAVCVPFGREGRARPEGSSGGAPPARIGVLFRAAAAAPVAQVLAEAEVALQLGSGPVLRYDDPRAGQRRLMRLGGDGTLQSFLLAGDASAQGWVLDLLQKAQPAAAFGRALLAASKQPPQPVTPRGRQVCACHDVSEEAIVATLATCEGDAARRLQHLQTRLRCGTECGSCLQAVKTLVQRHLEPAPAP